MPLIAKNRLIGVMDLESERDRTTSVPSTCACSPSPHRASPRPLRTPASTPASPARRRRSRCSTRSPSNWRRSWTSSPLLERVGQLLRRLIDYQMFTIMLLDEKGETLITRYAWRFGYAHAPLRRIPVTSGLVGAAVREWRLVNVPDVQQGPALPAHEPRDALGADRASLLQGPHHRRARPGTHAPPFLHRRARAHADHAGRAGGDRH